MLIREGDPTEVETKLPTNKLTYALYATHQLNKLKPKCILSQGGWFTAIPAMIYKLRNPKVKVIHLYHTHYDAPASLLKKLERQVEHLIMTYILSKFDIVLFVSRGLRKNVEENGALRVTTKWGVLYGAPTVKSPSKEEVKKFVERFEISSRDVYLIGHGLTAYSAKAKGAKLLIEALQDLPENVKLILTREGGFVPELKEHAKRLGVQDRVIFTGDLENPHVATKVADIYTHITFGEGGLSLALLEVMAIGKPIVASNVGGIPEAIRHRREGILIHNSRNELVSAIRELYESPKDRKKMEVISKKSVKYRFNWKYTASRLLELLEVKVT